MRKILIALSMAASIAAGFEARAVTLLADDRYVFSSSVYRPPTGGETVYWDERQDPAAPYAAFDANVQSVTQTSTVTPTSMVAVGEGWHYEDPQDDFTNRDVSQFSITFSVAAGTGYHVVFEYGQNAGIELENLDTGQFVSFSEQDDGYGTYLADASGTLDAATYRIRAWAEEGGVHQDPGHYDLALTLIPEPGAAILLVVAAFATLPRRRP